MAARIKASELPKGMRPKGRSKYRNVITEYNGVKYQSKAEAERAKELDSQIARGWVRFWVRQPTFRLGCPENVYRPDFLVVETGPIIAYGCRAEDVKGARTAKFNRDVKLWARYGPCPLWIIKGGHVEVVYPERTDNP